jgi:hypothetical protein
MRDGASRAGRAPASRIPCILFILSILYILSSVQRELEN